MDSKKQTDLMADNGNEKIICRNDGVHVDACSDSLWKFRIKRVQMCSGLYR